MARQDALRRRMLIQLILGGLLCIGAVDSFIFRSAAGYVELVFGIPLVVAGFATRARLKHDAQDSSIDPPTS